MAGWGSTTRRKSFLRRSLQIIEARGGKDSLEACSALNNLARVFQEAKRVQEADLLYRRCVQITEARLGKDHPSLIFSSITFPRPRGS